MRAVWVALPIAAGPAAAEVLAGWDEGPGLAAEVLLWAAWTVGLVAVLAPRPLGLTAFRVAGGGLLAAAVAAVAAPTPGSGAGPAVEVGVALAGTLAAAALAATPEVAEWFAQGASYGAERRLPLRHPRVVAVVLAPVAAVAVAAGVSAGPILLADGRLGTGVPALVAGLLVAARLGRSLHALSRRWLVLVPGGVVVHDPLVLSDPALLPSDRLRGVVAGDRPDGALDLRLGVGGTAVTLAVDPPVGLPVLDRRRGHTELVDAAAVTVAPSRPGAALEALSRHRVPIL